LKELIKHIYHKTKVVTVIEELHELNNRVVINHKTILRLMKSRLKKVLSELKNTSHKGEQGKIAPNLLQRNFKATAKPKWATDYRI
jgi:hypothetical protein